MAWTGFTDEQLNALKRQSSDDGRKQVSTTGRPQGQHPQRGRGRHGCSRGRGRAGPRQSVRQEPVNPDQMLSRPKPQGPRGGKPVSSTEHNVWNELNEPSQRRPPPGRRKAPPHQDKLEDGQTEGSKDEKKDLNPGVEDTKPETKVDEEGEKVKILDEDEGHEREISKLEEFQKKQKEMEEENAKKKSLLARAIADRKKKTQAEAKRLQYIQKELAKIENLLSNDVSILRDKIEEASRDYNDAERRYQKAETEFVAAKLHLHKATEMKEALTEHLCTIIHENELRKAKKLEELVSKLDVENLEEFDIPEETPPTSPKSSPHQTAEVPKNPSENNGMVQVSSNNPESQPAGGDNSTAPSGVADDKLKPASESELSTPSTTCKGEHSATLPSDEVGEHEGRTDVIRTDSTSSSVKSKEETSVSENNEGHRLSSDQPEAEQHVELNANQT